MSTRTGAPDPRPPLTSGPHGEPSPLEPEIVFSDVRTSGAPVEALVLDDGTSSLEPRTPNPEPRTPSAASHGAGESQPPVGPSTVGPLRRLWRGAVSAADWLVGLASLIAGLAVLSSVPVVQFLTLGYMLEVSGRVARTGRFTAGFVGVRKAARVGRLVLLTWLALLPVRLVSDFWYDAHVIDPTGPTTMAWRRALLVLTGLTGAHVVAAWFCGGGRYFYWPLGTPWYLLRTWWGSLRWSDWFPPAKIVASLRRGTLYREARDKLWSFVSGLRLDYYFTLGLKGYVGALVWLMLPVALLIGASSLPPGAAALSGLVGTLLMTVVALYLPFLEAQYAREGRLGAMYETGRVREAFVRAPFAFLTALIVTLALSLPLYLLEVNPLIDGLRFLPGLVFGALIFPGRLLAGWALARAGRRERPRWFPVRWLCRLAGFPAALFYVFIVYLSQFFAWHGPLHMFEQPPFMLPSPFLFLGQ